jgi:hypothetical protein
MATARRKSHHHHPMLILNRKQVVRLPAPLVPRLLEHCHQQLSVAASFKMRICCNEVGLPHRIDSVNQCSGCVHANTAQSRSRLLLSALTTCLATFPFVWCLPPQKHHLSLQYHHNDEKFKICCNQKSNLQDPPNPCAITFWARGMLHC